MRIKLNHMERAVESSNDWKRNRMISAEDDGQRLRFQHSLDGLRNVAKCVNNVRWQNIDIASIDDPVMSHCIFKHSPGGLRIEASARGGHEAKRLLPDASWAKACAWHEGRAFIGGHPNDRDVRVQLVEIGAD